MDYDIYIQDNKIYIYVISHDDDLMNTDISILEINEWDDLFNKSEIFKKWVNILNRESDNEYINIHPSIKNATYYLYHNCDYCKYNDFTSLKYYTGNKQDIYERVFMEVKNADRYYISANNFRKWISDNYEKFNENYNILKMHDEKVD
jgi:hypothetical protein